VDSRIRLIVASPVAASVAYLFAVVAFTGTLDLIAAGVFLVLFVLALLAFERSIQWAEQLDGSETPTAQRSSPVCSFPPCADSTRRARQAVRLSDRRV
jgi:ABC-type uncharacterized transport system permease subunit